MRKTQQLCLWGRCGGTREWQFLCWHIDVANYEGSLLGLVHGRQKSSVSGLPAHGQRTRFRDKTIWMPNYGTNQQFYLGGKVGTRILNILTDAA